MEVISELSGLRRKISPIVMAAGFFDGVHIGHRKVIDKAVSKARSIGGKSWILTFANHPLSIVDPRKAPFLLTTENQKIRILKELGCDGCLMLPFTKELAECSPEEFVIHLLENVPALNRIFVGRNWRFGYRGKGTPELLDRICSSNGVGVTVVTSQKRKGLVISSTNIRSAVAEGDMQTVAKLLGRDYSFTGTVVKGRTIGRELGYPTANIKPDNRILFPCGVYAASALVGSKGRKLYNGVLNYGVRPTFGDGGKGSFLELNLFDFSGDLYGKEMEVHVKKLIRREKRFDSAEELQRQIADDVKRAKKIL